LSTVFNTTVQVPFASCETGSNGVVGVRLNTQCASVGAFCITADAGVSQSTRIDIRAWRVCSIAIPSRNITKEGDERASAIDAVAATDLIHIASTGKIAICIRVDGLRSIITTPALLSILRASENIASGRAKCNAILVSVVGT
jgi:hypothetical protein